MNLTTPLRRRLVQAARAAAKASYSPYSRFPVGAAVLAASGKIYGGANVENASYGLCNCAERTALFNAVTAGCQPGDFAALAVVTDTDGVASPCGACRQVMAELCDAQMPVLLANLRGDMSEITVDALLPGAFTLNR